MNLIREYLRPLRPGVLQITRAVLDDEMVLWPKRCRLLGLTILANTGAPACFPVLFDHNLLSESIPGTAKTDVTQAGVFPPGTTAQSFADGDNIFGQGIVETPDRILVLGADDPSEGGIYEMTAQGLARPTDADADADFAASFTVTNVNTGLTYVWSRPVTGFTLGASKVLFTPETTLESQIKTRYVSSLYMFEGPSVISHGFDPGLLFEKGLFLRYASDWEGQTRNATGYWQTTAIIETQRA